MYSVVQGTAKQLCELCALLEILNRQLGLNALHTDLRILRINFFLKCVNKEPGYNNPRKASRDVHPFCCYVFQ